jgi:chaperonin GroES
MTTTKLKPKEELNPSGITPIEFKVLIKIDEVEEISKGGIIMTAGANQREQAAEVKGVILAIGGNAFEGFKSPPEVGDRVVMNKYAGIETKGQDDINYRLVNDKEISAIINF